MSKKTSPYREPPELYSVNNQVINAINVFILRSLVHLQKKNQQKICDVTTVKYNN